MNLKTFFDSIRQSLFTGKISQGAIDTINAILITCNKYGITDQRQIAYILATAKHEAFNTKYNPDWRPVREGFAMKNQGAINAVTSLFNSKKISKNHAPALENGNSYYGRGLVQITHPTNLY